MRQITGYLLLSLALLFVAGCKEHNRIQQLPGADLPGQTSYQDRPFQQEYSVKFYFGKFQHPLSFSVLSANRDGQIRVLSNDGLLVPDQGSLFYSGGWIPDISYPQMLPKKIQAIATYRGQTIFLDSKQLFSMAGQENFRLNMDYHKQKFLPEEKISIS